MEKVTKIYRFYVRIRTSDWSHKCINIIILTSRVRMIDSKYLIFIVVAIIAAITVVLCFTSKETYKGKSTTKDLDLSLGFDRNRNETCHHLESLKKKAGYIDDIFLENQLEKYYKKQCTYPNGYEKETKEFPNHNSDVCNGVRALMERVAVYDLGNEIELHDDLEGYYNKCCKNNVYENTSKES
jgi:hypothetical protein